MVSGRGWLRARVHDRWVAARIGVRWKCRVVSGDGSGGECEYGSIEDVVADMQPYEHCCTQKYETYVLLTVLRHAFVRAHRDT